MKAMKAIKSYQNYENGIKNMKSYQNYEQLSKTGELNSFLLNLKNILPTYKSIYFSRILKNIIAIPIYF